MRARTAHIVDGGQYLPHGLNRQVPATHYGLWCELCEWTVTIPRRHGPRHVEALRRQHLGRVHTDALIEGSAVLEPTLADPGNWLATR